ncbi:SET domain-containing protein [Basidiobolus meristosporus CBS 931.73]|uniref:SET domain-containing protein n=1 Tax=Basidiobolus meristosporus CBS 931.73 TaxID=1314790 RepID=A0A1Y1Y314_9FUNG|nr:SET domain-containing protein [Basidiobolus meristosporus CBS 931.73]|eukprot:ORX92411.1 SET domain-containing protein [Basidiobolus meristosporus CBS 931.73]
MSKARFVASDAKDLKVGTHSEGPIKRMIQSVPNGVYAFVFYVVVFVLIGKSLEPIVSYSGITSDTHKLHRQNILLQNEMMQAILRGKKVESIEHPDERRFYMEDFKEYHQVIPAHTMMVDPLIERFVHAHDIRTDEEYTEDEYSQHRLSLKYGPYITEGTRNDKRYYIRWVDDIRGYGLFASVNIPSGAILGVYGGYLTNNSYTTDYMWNYKGQVLDDQGEKVDLGIDAKLHGNWFRFANHHDEPNTRGVYVPFNNMWHVMYVTETAIVADSQIFVSYGSNYWKERTKIL